MNQSSLYIYCRAALSLRGTVGESSRHDTVPLARHLGITEVSDTTDFGRSIYYKAI